MLTVTLKTNLADQVVDYATANRLTPEVFVKKAVQSYLIQCRREKIRAETEAFEQQQDMLLAQFPEQYVAVHEGQVIDHDSDLRTLQIRVFASLGRVPVLLKKVTTKPERDLVFRSTRLV
ncbi:MAG: hypothetical protein ACPGWR_16125 [Ardenticatenaceae bacterium]